MRFLKRLSKWSHKYIGLLLLSFLAWMSISGILLNHPGLISGIDVPHWMLPSAYQVENWERGTLREVVFSTEYPEQCLAYGDAGIWESRDSGTTFQSLMSEGFPEQLYGRKTTTLLLVESPAASWIIAGTYNGIYMKQWDEDRWHRIPFGETEERPKRLLRVEDTLYLFTTDNVYTSPIPPKQLRFQRAHPTQANANTVTLITLLFDLHDGSVWGFPGKLLFDIAGAILFILSITALYTWYYPKKLKFYIKHRSEKPTRNPRVFKFLLRYHLSLGIWSSGVLLIITGTGLFMRPPLLALIANHDVAAGIYPGFLPYNPWHGEIRNAVYEPVTGSFLIDCKDGMYAGPMDFSAPFHRIQTPAPVFVMGATVMQCNTAGTLLLGSFNGLYAVNLRTYKAVDVIHGTEVQSTSSLRPGEYFITGYFQTPDSVQYATAFSHGLIKENGESHYGPFPMPPEARRQGMPLWHFLFELHNGRIFSGMLGTWNILLVPLGALLSIFLILTGMIDWIVLRRRKLRTRTG